MGAHTTSALAGAAEPAWVSQWRLPVPSRGPAPTSYALYPQPLPLPLLPTELQQDSLALREASWHSEGVSAAAVLIRQTEDVARR
jgi:hypothetical protein